MAGNASINLNLDVYKIPMFLFVIIQVSVVYSPG